MLKTQYIHLRKDFPDVVILKAVVQLPQMMKPDSIDFILKENKADLHHHQHSAIKTKIIWTIAWASFFMPIYF